MRLYKTQPIDEVIEMINILTKQTFKKRNYLLDKKWIEVRYHLFGFPIYIKRIPWY